MALFEAANDEGEQFGFDLHLHLAQPLQKMPHQVEGLKRAVGFQGLHQLHNHVIQQLLVNPVGVNPLRVVLDDVVEGFGVVNEILLRVVIIILEPEDMGCFICRKEMLYCCP